MEASPAGGGLDGVLGFIEPWTGHEIRAGVSELPIPFGRELATEVDDRQFWSGPVQVSRCLLRQYGSGLEAERRDGVDRPSLSAAILTDAVVLREADPYVHTAGRSVWASESRWRPCPGRAG